MEWTSNGMAHRRGGPAAQAALIGGSCWRLLPHERLTELAGQIATLAAAVGR